LIVRNDDAVSCDQSGRIDLVISTSRRLTTPHWLSGSGIETMGIAASIPNEQTPLPHRRLRINPLARIKYWGKLPSDFTGDWIEGVKRSATAGIQYACMQQH
jgi:hypothetical protein